MSSDEYASAMRRGTITEYGSERRTIVVRFTFDGGSVILDAEIILLIFDFPGGADQFGDNGAVLSLLGLMI
jgi:hypothetical protein